MNIAGYTIHTERGRVGQPGTAYTYVMAGNGLFLEVDNGLIEARIHLTTIAVRGLPLLHPELRLPHGKVPTQLLSLVLSAMAAASDRETYAAIVWDADRYRLVWPTQDGSAACVVYETVPHTVVGVHSHGTMGAFFSFVDDRDDTGFQVAVVVGRLNRLVPAASARLAIYGYHAPVDLGEVFTGLPPWIAEFGVKDYE